MSGGEARADDRCPECAAPLVRSEARFSPWCRGCDWNVDPQEKHRKRPGRIARVRHRIEDGLAASLYDKITGQVDVRRRAKPAEVAAVAIAVVVHLYTLGLLVLAGWIAYVGWRYPVAWIAIVLLPGIAFVIRPRFSRLDDDVEVVSRQDAPTLHALVDRMRAEVGAPPIDVLAVGTDFNAFAGAVGVRQRKVLVIGLPLWNVLGRQERVDLLGHELGHLVSGDLRRGLVVGTAMQSLGQLDQLFQGDTEPVVTGHPTGMEGVAGVAMKVVGLPARLTLVALALLTLRAGQRAEYFADRLGSKLGGSDATVNGFGALLLGPLLMHRLAVEARRRKGGPSLWEVQREYVREFPALERERLLRAAAKERARADDTHPPTHLRIKLAERPEGRVQPAIVLGQGEAEAIDRELKPWYDKLEKALRDEQLRAMYL